MRDDGLSILQWQDLHFHDQTPTNGLHIVIHHQQQVGLVKSTDHLQDAKWLERLLDVDEIQIQSV